jgi:hypothetical protein
MRIESIQTFTNRSVISFRSPPGISNQLEAANSFPPTNWQSVGFGLKGNNALQTLTDTNINNSARFFRLRQLNNLP